ncbi:MAG TPA: metalloregulator ArsR/SmtB family transcription factor [Candidatus Saccharimonadales bacterium]|nr:metalloregulator ArsR/SmtB family transcription factor [Candidatus Saccharimonadales bacterium]
MVEYTLPLDDIFSSLADPTRRDILSRLVIRSLNVGQIAKDYDMSLAAVSKHLKVMEHAKLVIKQRRGKEHIVSIMPDTIRNIDEYLDSYRQLWERRLDSLEDYLNETEE